MKHRSDTASVLEALRELIFTNSSLSVSRYIVKSPLQRVVDRSPERVQHLPQLSRRTARSLDFMGESSLRFPPRRVCAFRYLEEHPSIQHQRELMRWLFPLSAFLLFALFDFASDAQKQYRSLFRSCHKALLRNSASSKSTKIPYLPRSVLFFLLFYFWSIGY